ncbi:hypothetical protein DFH06DRAFT_1233470 [Mycena polygramma]|nr:hypothetical protein DFH06DRAFT_1233470 [Mycena polygramma]
MLPQLSVLRRLPRLAEPTKRWKSRSKKGSVAPRAQDSRQSQVEPEIGQTTLDILRAMLREARSEDGAVNSSPGKGSVARSAPTEGPHHELGAVMDEKTPRSEFAKIKRSKSSFEKGSIAPIKPRSKSQAVEEAGQPPLYILRAILARERSEVRTAK